MDRLALMEHRETRELRSFVAVAEELHLGRAAVRISPASSRARRWPEPVAVPPAVASLVRSATELCGTASTAPVA